MISLVTGHTGTEHVTSKQVGRFNAALHGKGNYILDVGDKCQVDVIDSNKIRINKGELMCQGRHISIESPEDITITGGTLGQTTYALVYIHYSIDDSGIESVSLQTKALTSADNYDLSGSILDGSSTADIELARVSLNGYSISKAEMLLQVIKNTEQISNDTSKALEDFSKKILKQVMEESLRVVDFKKSGDLLLSNKDCSVYFKLNNGLEFEFGRKIIDDNVEYYDTYIKHKVSKPIYANVISRGTVLRNNSNLWYKFIVGDVDFSTYGLNWDGFFYCENASSYTDAIVRKTELEYSIGSLDLKYLVIGYSGD